MLQPYWKKPSRSAILKNCNFSFHHYFACLNSAQDLKHCFYTFDNYEQNVDKLILLRHDIDYPTIEKAIAFARIENSLGIQATYFVRLHSNDYNPFGYRFYSGLKEIMYLGHEIGLHHEVLDFYSITKEDPGDVLRKDKKVLETILGRQVKGLVPHQDWTRIPNWKFSETWDYKDFGFEYEAEELCKKENITCISDSLAQWTNDECMCQVIGKQNKLCITVHPFYWYKKHFFLK